MNGSPGDNQSGNHGRGPVFTAGVPAIKLTLLRVLLVALGLGGWFGTQQMLGARQPKSSPEELAVAGRVLTRGDGLHAAFEPWHAWLFQNRSYAHALLIASSLCIDVLGFFLLGWSIFGRSIRPFLGLLMLFVLRQLCQVISALPAPEQMIWEPPGFDSILVYYKVANDFFFSGHTALAVYGGIELARFGGRWWRVPAAILCVFLAGTVIVLRAHFTMDVYAGAVTALCAVAAANWLAPRCDRWLERMVGMKAS